MEKFFKSGFGVCVCVGGWVGARVCVWVGEIN